MRFAQGEQGTSVTDQGQEGVTSAAHTEGSLSLPRSQRWLTSQSRHERRAVRAASGLLAAVHSRGSGPATLSLAMTLPYRMVVEIVKKKRK